MTEMVCPKCGSIYEGYVEPEYINSPTAWHRSGYLVKGCSGCRSYEQRIVSNATDK